MVRTALVMLACVACETSPRSNAATVQASVAPRSPATRDDLLAATLVAVAASDRAALDRLSDDGAMDRLLDCRDPVKARKARERYRKREAELVAALGGAPLELVGVDDDQTLKRVAAGDAVGGGCSAKLAFETHVIAMTVKSGGRVEHVRLHALRVGDRWQLGRMPSKSEGTSDLLVEMRDRICACKDVACADAVQKDIAQRAELESKTEARAPTEEDMKLAKEMSECFQKLYATNAGSGTP